jgi:hypothetical protein
MAIHVNPGVVFCSVGNKQVFPARKIQGDDAAPVVSFLVSKEYYVQNNHKESHALDSNNPKGWKQTIVPHGLKKHSA